MAVLLFGRTQDSWGTPFDPSDPNAIAAGLSSLTVQQAIIEALNEAPGTASRYNLFFGHDNNVNSGTWLEQYKNLPSNLSPFAIAEKSIVRTLSISLNANTTGAVGLFKNGVLLTSISLTAARIAIVSGLNFPLLPGDSLSARPTSGTLPHPSFNIGIQVTP